MSELPWIILGKRYRYDTGKKQHIFIFTSYDKDREAYNFDYRGENNPYWHQSYWYSGTLEIIKDLFILLDRLKIEDDPEYFGLFI